jgi:putative hemolysin
MRLITSKDILRVLQGRDERGHSLVNKLMSRILRLDKLNKLCNGGPKDDPRLFLDNLVQALGVTVEVREEDLRRLPATGAFVTVSNHPFGGLDWIILAQVSRAARSDYKVMVSHLMKQLSPTREYFLETGEGDLSGAAAHLQEGRPLGVFPATEVSSYQADLNQVEDGEWDAATLRLIKGARVPVVPVYFKGSNSLLFYLLGLIHPVLRGVKLPSELLNKKNRVVKLRVGNPVDVETQDGFHDIVQYGKFLRAKTYLLGSSLEVKKFFIKSQRAVARVEAVATEIDRETLRREVESVAADYTLFSMKNYEVYCTPSVKIPNVLNEIGRLRELTFRAVGEGTNRSIDLDEYDLYYYHLFIWDKEAGQIVGAYRLGKGKEIIDRYGMRGFYIHSLFKMRKEMLPVLYESIELGRSFIREEYQRKPLPLFMLWKGILYFLLKHPEYRYLIGPVTISGRYTEVSKELIMRFVMAHYYDHELARYVLPRSRYLVGTNDPKVQVMLDVAREDIGMLDKMIGDIEPTSDKLPVLLKKYISLNAKIIGFNIDPKFNMCLDGLLILDIFDIPMKTIESLSKEINDGRILDRFSTENIEL